MKQEEKKSVYGVFILRNDGQHISVVETDSYDKAFELWGKLSQDWEDAVTANKPFKLTDPIVTAFAPGLISEITVRPLATTTESKYQNPYEARMMKQGLSSMANLGDSTVGPVLDGGYR